MNDIGCPICGYQNITVLDKQGCTTFEICDSCGSEAGCDYNANSTNEHLEKTRMKWAKVRNYKWWSSTSKPPANWDPAEQMKQAGICLLTI